MEQEQTKIDVEYGMDVTFVTFEEEKILDDGLIAMKRTWGDRLLELIDAGPGFAPNSLARPLMDDAKTLGKLAAQRDPDMSDTDATVAIADDHEGREAETTSTLDHRRTTVDAAGNHHLFQNGGTILNEYAPSSVLFQLCPSMLTSTLKA